MHQITDTCLGKQRQRYQTNSLKNSVKINPWTVPSINFTFYDSKPKNIEFEAKKNRQYHEKPRNEEFARIPLPKRLEKPVSKDTKFVTSFRSPSARTSRIIGVKEGTYPAGPYKPWGPHAFRGDDFRPDGEQQNKERKPPFVTSYSRDRRNLELQRNISQMQSLKCEDRNRSCTREERPKPFLTNAEQQPKWDHNLFLKKEKYQRGLSEEEIRMNRIMKQLSWYSGDVVVETLDRPDIKDYKLVDWLRVTRHSEDETTVLC
ncbi:uncharacterized protein LOC114521406 isoform X2 [Dendronephthya gigantea]|uniref:uncharacterized protein LOC114521406 isoform X2 n=1 Tax=Dendronephthya gigantea TaxID=151771 RepID=UPI00106CBCCF|nr:uncharacterized protein LOC114521406 isoform X2 [Dendronephthya gigantea]